jgi:hypothetical protein
MSKFAAVKAALLGAALSVFLALPAWAQTTPGAVKDDVIEEATPYFTVLVGIVVALFGLALLVTLARKAAGMAKGGIRKG